MTESRAAWENYIRLHSGRYLYAGIAGEFALLPDAPAPQEVADFLSKLQEKADVDFLALVYFLLRPEVQEFFANGLPRLLRSLAGAVSGSRYLSRRGARGKVLWSDTFRARSMRRANTANYVVWRTQRTIDVPENRLVKSFVTRARHITERAARLVGTSALLGDIEAVHSSADVALRNPYLRQIPEGIHITAQMRHHTSRHRNRLYGQVARLDELLEHATYQSKWSAIVSLLQRGWLSPIHVDDLFELYVLLRVLDALATIPTLGPPRAYGLVARPRAEVATFVSRSGLKVGVVFDQYPRDYMQKPSRYSEILADYPTLHGAPRRPDIAIQVSRPGSRPRRLLIEVKRTDDGGYQRDSVYKAFAYTYDFDALWPDPAQSPKVVLVMPESLQPAPGHPPTTRDVVLVSVTADNRLDELIKSVVGVVRRGRTRRGSGSTGSMTRGTLQT